MPRHAPLQMTPDRFRAVGHALVDRIADRLARVASGPVKPDEPPEAVRAAVHADRPLPREGREPQALVSEAADLLFDHSTLNGHPRFLGYITSSPAPIGMFGDLLAAAANPNCGGWAIAPAATEIEVQTVRWIAELVGFPATAGGLLVSGGNMANFVCFLAARTAKAGWDVRKTGLSAGAPALVVYASAETHTWIQKAADLFGLGTDAIRWIAVDAQRRMNVAELRRQIEEDRTHGRRPFLVVGTAGSVSTGAVDPLPDIAAVCRDYDLWFHVDGAYGGFAAPIPGVPPELRGLTHADSLAVDPHKWLYAPLEAGCALVRRPEHLRDAYSYHPPYYKLKDDVVNFVDYGPQNSRGFRALKVWLALQQIGRDGYEASIAEDMRLSRRLAEALAAHGDFEVVTQSLSITTFRYVPRELRTPIDAAAALERLNTLNQDVLSRVEKSGEAFLSNAVVDGKFLLRACIVNFNTSEEDVDALPGIVARHAARAWRSAAGQA